MNNKNSSEDKPFSKYKKGEDNDLSWRWKLLNNPFQKPFLSSKKSTGGSGSGTLTPMTFSGVDTTNGYLYYKKSGKTYLITFPQVLPANFKMYDSDGYVVFNSSVSYDMYKFDPMLNNWYKKSSYNDDFWYDYDLFYHSYPSYLYTDNTFTTPINFDAIPSPVAMQQLPSVDLSKGYIQMRSGEIWYTVVFNANVGTTKFHKEGLYINSSAPISHTVHSYNETTSTWSAGTSYPNSYFTNIVIGNLLHKTSVDIYTSNTYTTIHMAKNV